MKDAPLEDCGVQMLHRVLSDIDAGILTKDFEPGAKDVGAGGLAEQFVTALETRRTRITRFSAWNSTTDYQ